MRVYISSNDDFTFVSSIALFAVDNMRSYAIISFMFMLWQ